MALTNVCITSSSVRPGARVQFLNTSVSLLVSISGAIHVKSSPFSSITGKRWRAVGKSGADRDGGGALGTRFMRAEAGLVLVEAAASAPASANKTARDKSAA